MRVCCAVLSLLVFEDRSGVEAIMKMRKRGTDTEKGSTNMIRQVHVFYSTSNAAHQMMRACVMRHCRCL